MKKFISLFPVCLALISSVTYAGAASPQQPHSDDDSAQQQKIMVDALELGIAWDELAERADTQITLGEAARLIGNGINIAFENNQSVFLDNYMKSNDADAPLRRFQLAELIWGTYKEMEYHTLDYLPMVPVNGGYVVNGSFDRIEIWNCPDIDEIDSYTDATGCNFAITAFDRLTGDKVMTLYDDYTFRPSDLVMVSDAVASALHFTRFFEEEPVYVAVDEVEAHSIDSALYTGETTLPDATNQKLPSWRGLNVSHESMLVPGALSGSPDARLREADVEYLAEIGANFMHIYLSWSYFQGPTYTCDSKVNLTRLEELDQIISWCMERDIHIQLVFNDVPNIDGLAVDLDQWRELSAAVFTDAAVRDTVTEFWRMLARRYADIPNNYLSFNLMNECNPSDDDTYVWGFQDAVEAIWEESPGRVIVADIHGDNFTGEGMAKLGCALSYHLYAPRNVTVVSQEQEDAIPGYYENLTWPACIVNAIIYGPYASGDFPDLVDKPISIDGDIGGAVLTIRINDLSTTDTTMKITADDEVLYDGMEAYEYDRERDFISVSEPISVTIPENTEMVKIFCAQGYALSMSDLSLTLSNGVKPNILLAMDYWKGTPIAEVSMFKDGSFASSLTLADIRMGASLNQLIEIGKAHDVAVMVGEFGIFELEMYSFGIRQDTVDAIMQEQTALFDDLGLAWSCEYIGRYAAVSPTPYLENVTYRKLMDTPYYENVSMRRLYESLLTSK